MTDYFVGTLRQCQAYISKMNSFMGYPNESTKTDTYAVPVQHKGRGKESDYLVIIKSVHAPSLDRKAELEDIDNRSTDSEIAKRKTRSALEKEDAFKEDPLTNGELDSKDRARSTK
jgi:hypothetical protein